MSRPVSWHERTSHRRIFDFSSLAGVVEADVADLVTSVAFAVADSSEVGHGQHAVGVQARGRPRAVAQRAGALGRWSLSSGHAREQRASNRAGDHSATTTGQFPMFQQLSALQRPVLKTGMGKLIVGSNPTPSAIDLRSMKKAPVRSDRGLERSLCDPPG
jgi:hypothetical protein